MIAKPKRDCPRCKRRLPMTRQAFTVRRSPKGRIWWGCCRDCANEMRRDRYRRARKDPERVAQMRASNREAMRRYRERHPERVAASQARWEASMRSDPDRLANFRVARRIEERDRHGHVRALARAVEAYEPPPMNHANPMLSAQPLAEWLRYRFGGAATKETAGMLGVDEATLRRLLDGTSRRVSLHVADRMFVNAREPHLLAILYPLPDEESRAA